MKLDMVPIGSLGAVVTGRTPSALHENGGDAAIEFITPADVDALGALHRGSRVVGSNARNEAQVVQVNSVLFVGIGATLGKTALVDRQVAINQQFHAVQTKNRRDATLLREILARSGHLFWRRAGNGGMPILTKAAFSSIVIPWPNESGRKLAYEALDAINAMASSAENLICAKRDFKRGLAQRLLSGRERFPGFLDKPWIEVRLGDVFTERSEASRSDLPLLSVTSDRGVIPRDELDKRDTSNPDKSKYKRVAIGDVAYNTMRMWQGVSALSSLEGIVSPAYTVVVPTARIDGGFARHLFKFAPVVHLFHRYSQGLVDDTLNLKYDRFARIHVRIPHDVEEQQKIAAILDLCDEELLKLATQRENYSHYKRGLLARLLAGEFPVSS